MNRALRTLLVALLTVGGALWSAGLARADVNNSTGTNVQSGNNRSTGTQSGASKSGDAVGGQVTGVVSSGRTSVDARNTSSNSDVTSGDARGGNTANTFTGLSAADTTTVGAADVTGVSNADNLQDGDNRSTYTQTANYTTGDGVAGEVIGVVTAAGGSASIVAANTSTNDSVETGDARGSNDLAAFTGLNEAATTTVAPLGADITNSCNSSGGDSGCDNAQTGNNRTTARQTSAATTGDGVAGQVIGAVAGGATSIDATNRSDNVDVTSGEARSDNAASAFTGLQEGEDTTFAVGGAADVTNSCNGGCENLLDGNNTTTLDQSATSKSGDGVGGQVIGAVTSAGGSASIVAANTSTNSDITSGDATSANNLAAFVGLNDSGTTTVAADITTSCAGGGGCDNLQSGNNRLTGSQAATSTTGDGVGGQVIHFLELERVGFAHDGASSLRLPVELRASTIGAPSP